MQTSLIPKLKKSHLTGRGGAAFPTYKKWEAVKKSPDKKKYIVINGSEGEPGVLKDKHILTHYPEILIDGIKLAMKEIKAKKAIIFLNKDYYKKFGPTLRKLAKPENIELFKKQGGYLSGEETTLLNELERNPQEPRLKPPYPTSKGLYGHPTLVNNVETIYSVALIAKNEYKNTRFFSITGDVKHKGVFEFPENSTINHILKETKNIPKKDFFVQVGGGAIGEIFLPKELNRKVSGAGAIIVYDKKTTDPYKLMKHWADFFFKYNCDKCVPCREGIFRIREMLSRKKIDWQAMDDIFFSMEKTSFCPLGKGAPLPFKTLCQKLKLK